MTEHEGHHDSTEVITEDDYPEAKPEDEFTVERDVTTADIEFRDGNIRVDATGDVSFTTSRAKLDKVKGRKVVNCGKKRINGKRQRMLLPAPNDVYTRLGELKEEYAEWRESAEEWVEEQPLRFAVEHHEYKTGTHRTKYNTSSDVLKKNKPERLMTSAEKRLVESLRDEFGEADGYPDVNDEDDFEEGEVYDADALEELVEERVDDKLEEEREEERWGELCEEHPELRGVSGVDVDGVEEAFNEAIGRGEKVEIVAVSEYCNEPSYECDIDNVRYYATPDGGVEKKRIHTH